MKIWTKRNERKKVQILPKHKGSNLPPQQVEDETPQQVEDEDYYGRDVDLLGIAQTNYFCLQGCYAYENYTEDKK